MLHVAWCMPHVACCTSNAACCTSHAACCMPHVACCMLHVAYCISSTSAWCSTSRSSSCGHRDAVMTTLFLASRVYFHHHRLRRQPRHAHALRPTRSIHPAPCSLSGATCEMRHATMRYSTLRHATCDIQQARREVEKSDVRGWATRRLLLEMKGLLDRCQHATCNVQRATYNIPMQHAICNMQHATCASGDA